MVCHALHCCAPRGLKRVSYAAPDFALATGVHWSNNELELVATQEKLAGGGLAASEGSLRAVTE